MTAAERHAELTRLRALWAEAVYLAGAAKPGTSDWRMARFDERRAGAEYLRVLADPYQPGSQTDPVATPAEVESTPEIDSLRLALGLWATSRESHRRSLSRRRVQAH
jgi:hypothetical protein